MGVSLRERVSGERLRHALMAGVQRVLASREELKTLTEKVDKLTEAVAALVQKMDDGAKTGTKKASF